MSRKITFWLIVLVAVAFGQEAAQDNWFIIDKFAGLQYYLDETSLPPGQALEATNVQFRKVGTVSGLEGMELFSQVSADITFGDVATRCPPRGIGFIVDAVNDSDRIVVADSGFLFNTTGNSRIFDFSSCAVGDGIWQTWPNDSSRVHDTLDRDMAAYLWRPGWSIRWTIFPPVTYAEDTIGYIWDNGTFFLTTILDDALFDTIASMSTRVLPRFNEALPVQFVDLSIESKPSLLVLQAGMEPVLFSGDSYDNCRWFGVADSGRAVYCEYSVNSSTIYLVDNSKIGIYGENELANAGYWVHMAGPFGGFSDPLDSSLSGMMWRIDSNVVFKRTGGQYEFRIWWTVADSTNKPLQDSLLAYNIATRNKPYQIVSAPILRELYSVDETPMAEISKGGVYLKVAASDTTFTAGEFDHYATYLEVKTDSLHGQAIDTIASCVNGFCDTFYVDKYGTRWRPRFGASARGIDLSLPVRTSYVDTTGTDTLVIEMQGRAIDATMTTFPTSDYALYRATIPYASGGIVYRDRLYLAGDPTSPNTICFSDKGLRGAQYGAFPVANVIQLPGNGDVFTAFASIYDWLMIFQERHTFLLKQDPAGGGELEVILADEGCIAPNSVVEFENKVIYLSHKGWREFDGNTSRDFAQAIKPAVQGFPRTPLVVNQAYKKKSTAAFDPNNSNIWMCMPFGSDTVNNGSFIYNTVADAVSYTNEVFGGIVKSFPFLDTTRLLFTHPSGVRDSAAIDTANRLYDYFYRDTLPNNGIDGDSMDILYATGWLDLGFPQQKKFVSDGTLIAKLGCPTDSAAFRKFVVRMFRDFDTTAFYADTVNVFSMILGVHYVDYQAVRLQPETECEFLKIELEGFGLNEIEIQRLALRWNAGSDVVRSRTTLRRN